MAICQHSKVLLVNRYTGETKFLNENYFRFVASIDDYNRLCWRNASVGNYNHLFFPKYDYFPIECGKCYYCKKKRINKWKLKLLSETRTCEKITHLTLTFDDEHLSDDYSIFQKCVKRVRRYLDYHNIGKSFKFFLVSEHGEQSTCRLHYHVLIFGLDLQTTRKLFSRFWRQGFIKVKPYCENQVHYLCNYIFKQNEIRRQSQKLGYKFWFKQLQNGLIRMGKFYYNFPYYFRKKYFSDSNRIFNAFKLSKVKAELQRKYVKLKDKAKLAKQLFSEATQANLEAKQFFVKYGYKV